jgi:hypothetical protein
MRLEKNFIMSCSIIFTLYHSITSIKSRGMRWIGHVACMEDEKCVHYLIRKPEGKRPLSRPRHR